MSLREIEERFDKKHASLFQEYYIIVNAIPKVWKQNMLRQVHVHDATQKENEGVIKNVWMNVNTKVEVFYSTLSIHSIVRPPIEEKWEEMLNSTEQIDWKGIWSFNLQAMKESKYQNSILSYYTTYYQIGTIYLNGNCVTIPYVYDDQLHDNLHLFVKCKHTRLFG